MIEGTPARLLMLVSMNRPTRLCPAYSSRYTAAPTPSGTEKMKAMKTTHSEPRMAVRTPAYSGLDDCGEVRKLPVTQLRKSSRELGISSAASSIAPRLKIDSIRFQVAAILGLTTSSVRSWTSSSFVRCSSGLAAASARARPAETFALSMAILSAVGTSASVLGKTVDTKKSSVPLSLPGM